MLNSRVCDVCSALEHTAVYTHAHICRDQSRKHVFHRQTSAYFLGRGLLTELEAWGLGEAGCQQIFLTHESLTPVLG